MFSIAHPIQTSDSQPSLSPKAAQPRAPETAAGPGAKAFSGIKTQEAPLAAYLMARAALHRKIEGQVLKNLRAGHESVQEACVLLPLGRANVREDLRKANSLGAVHLHLAAVKLRRAMRSELSADGGAMTAEIYSPLCAAASQYAKTGTCFSYASTTTALHAAKLAGMEEKRAIVAESNHMTIDHVWSEMIPHGKGEDGKPILHGEDVVMDGWCKERLAVLREDSAFARLDQDGQGNPMRHAHLLDHESGPKALAKMERFKAQIEKSPALQRVFHAKRRSLMASGTKPDESSLWDAQPICHEEFRQEASAALHKDAWDLGTAKGAGIQGTDPAARRPKHASLAEIQAVGVARSLGSNIRGAVAEAPEILAAAKEMFPRPESMGERLLASLLACLGVEHSRSGRDS